MRVVKIIIRTPALRTVVLFADRTSACVLQCCVRLSPSSSVGNVMYCG